jgi:hypothetical protein
MIKLWKFLAIPIVAAVCLGLMLVPGAPPQVALASGNVTVAIEPATTSVATSTSFTIDAVVNNPDGMDIAGFGIRLDFDPTYFTVDSVSLVDLPEDMGPAVIDNVNGTIQYDPKTALGTSINGTHVVAARINCTAKALEGVSTVDYVYIMGPPPRYTKVIVGTTDYLEGGNMSLMHSGTVIVGVPPTIAVSPNSLAFNAVEGGENPADQTLELCNRGSGTVDWSLTDNAGWLSETPASGSLDEDKCEDVTVSVDVTGMEAGDYSATITGSDEVRVPVSLHIESAAPVGPANLSASSLSISPQQAQPDEEVTISINVANTGGATGSYDAVLYINEVVEGSQTVSVEPGTSKNVIFTVSKSQAGVYDVSLAGQSGQFEVVGGGWVDGGGLGTGGIIAIVVVIAFIVGLFLILRGRRREV